LGSAFAFVGVLKLASLWLPPSRFAFIAGLATSLGMVGAMVGDILQRIGDVLGSSTTLNFSAMAGVILMLVICVCILKRACKKRKWRPVKVIL